MTIELDLGFYREANSDIAGLTDAQLQTHFETFGINETRLFSPLVNLGFYRASNSDLNGFNNKQLLDHLNQFGIDEGRQFSDIIDLDFYKQSNSDLAGLSNRELLKHLKDNVLDENGPKQNRQFSPFFDIQTYRANNTDLANASSNFLLKHFQINGLNEEREFSATFNLKFYRSLYSDLQTAGLSNRQLLEHVQVYGLDEGRITSASFNVSVYLANNSDLTSFNNQEAYKHYLLIGQREGRSGTDYTGNTRETARQVSSRIMFTEFVGGTDNLDYYRFDLSSATNFSLKMDNLIANADLRLLDSEGAPITTSSNTGSISETINSILQAGTYYVEVSSVGEINTNYNLSLLSVVNLYNVSTSPNTTPDQISLLFENALFGGTQTANNDATNLNTTMPGIAGYSAYNPIVTLDSNRGYTIRFQAQLNSESHIGDSNGDNVSDQAGFNVTVVSSNLSGIELGFWNNEIWAKEINNTNSVASITHSTTESVQRNTTVLTDYELSIMGDSYKLYADGSVVLKGKLRNYSAMDGVYNVPDYLFLGDNSTSAKADINLKSISVGVAL